MRDWFCAKLNKDFFPEILRDFFCAILNIKKKKNRLKRRTKIAFPAPAAREKNRTTSLRDFFARS